MVIDGRKWVEEYSLPLLKWARSKAGNRDQAQDLVQEVWLQFFHAVRREEEAGRTVEQPEHLLWKVARYVWCGTLRKSTVYKRLLPLEEAVLPEEGDFAEALAEDAEQEQLLRHMRRRVAQLDRMQREILVLFHIEGVPQRQIAKRLGISEAAVKWHLFDTRRQLKKELTNMTEQEFIYRPHKLHIATSGQVVPHPDTDGLADNLLRQNICVLCYHQAQTADSLSASLGVPKAYIEHDLEWLLQREFLIREGKGFRTTFIIETTQQEQAVFAVHLKHRSSFLDAIADGLLAAEDQIRRIGFHGCDRPMNRLLWWLIYRWCTYALNPLRAPLRVEPPIRPDGGKYFPIAYDQFDADAIDIALDRTGWAYNGAMWEAGFRWFGLYNFGKSEIEDLLDGFTPQWLRLRTLLKQLIADGEIASLSGEQREDLALLIEKGFVTLENGRAVPAFCTFTEEQYRQLTETVFEPLKRRLSDELQSLYDDLAACVADMLPGHLSCLRPFKLKFALTDLGYVATILAFRRGLLYEPKDTRDGEFLTLLYLND